MISYLIFSDEFLLIIDTIIVLYLFNVILLYNINGKISSIYVLIENLGWVKI